MENVSNSSSRLIRAERAEPCRTSVPQRFGTFARWKSQAIGTFAEPAEPFSRRIHVRARARARAHAEAGRLPEKVRQVRQTRPNTRDSWDLVVPNLVADQVRQRSAGSA